jgi:hypothetical protein
MAASLSSPFDVDQLRTQARALRRSALAGARLARERIRKAHPRFDRQRLDDEALRAFTVRDAQLCIARELGFDGWRDVLAHAHGEAVDRRWRRWPDRPGGQLLRRAVDAASDIGARHVGPEMALGALLRPPQPTDALVVLNTLGATWEQWEQRHHPRQPADDLDKSSTLLGTDTSPSLRASLSPTATKT